MNVMNGQTIERLALGLDVVASSRLQMSTDSLFGCDMVHVSSCDPKTTLFGWTADSAGAAFFNWPEVIGIRLMT